MENHDSHPPKHPGRGQPHKLMAWKGAAIMVAAIVSFYVLREHWGHVLGLAPYLILLVCPLMHSFMHGDHGHRHDGNDKPRPK